MVLENETTYSKATSHLHDPKNYMQTSGKNVANPTCTTNDIQMDFINQNLNNYDNPTITNHSTLNSNNNDKKQTYYTSNGLIKNHQHEKPYTTNQLQRNTWQMTISMQDLDKSFSQEPSKSMQIDQIITTSPTVPLPNTLTIKKDLLNNSKDSNNTKKEVQIDPIVPISPQPKHEQSPTSPLPSKYSNSPNHQPQSWVKLGLMGHAIFFNVEINDQKSILIIQNTNYLAQLISDI